MKQAVDFNKALLAPDQAPLQVDGRAFLVGDALSQALLGTWSGDQRTAARKARDVGIMLAARGGPEAYAQVPLGDEDRMHLRQVAFATIPAAYLFVQVCEALGYDRDELTQTQP